MIAGPGTGKTFTLTERIARLAEKGVKPEEIFAVTFTVRAAEAGVSADVSFLNIRA